MTSGEALSEEGDIKKKNTLGDAGNGVALNPGGGRTGVYVRKDDSNCKL